MKSPLKITVSIPRTLGFHPDDESFFHPRCSLLRFLRFFTCVSWGISPAQILLIVQTTAIRHSIFYFSSFSMFIQSRISKSVVICLSFLSCVLFCSSFFSLFCFLPLFIHFIFWSLLLFFFQICYPFFSLFLLLCSVSSLLCSITIQSVLFLLVFIFSDLSI